MIRSALPYCTRWTASPRNCVWPYFVAGALARDIVLNGVFGLASGRATRDVDFAVALESWEQFEAIKAQLIATGRFEAVREVAQRLYYKPQPKLVGYPLDIIPFRGVEAPPNTIVWPPDLKVMMNVMGYEEALAAAQEVEVGPGFVVPVSITLRTRAAQAFRLGRSWGRRPKRCPGPHEPVLHLCRRG
ncbi:MAG: hypothetical protein ACRED0_05755 [Gammaproteobacteria bacterium]